MNGMGLTFQSGNSHRRVRASEILSRGSVQVHGANLFYEASGTAEDGPTLLLLHDSGGSSATWHGQMTGLAHRARCIVPDLPGHGRSEGVGCTSVEEYRQKVIAFLDALAIRWPVVLGGVCLGAAVAVDLALHVPDRVAGLVLAGLSPEGRACEETRAAAARGEVSDAFIKSLFSPFVSQRLLMDRLKRWRLTGPTTRHRDLTAVRKYPLGARLAAVTHPTLLVCGDCDAIATPEMVRELAATMSDVRAETISRAGCLCMAEQSQEFNKVISDFLAELQPEAPVEPEERQVWAYRRF